MNNQRPDLDAIEADLKRHDEQERRPGGWRVDDTWLSGKTKTTLYDLIGYARALEARLEMGESLVLDLADELDDACEYAHLIAPLWEPLIARAREWAKVRK